MKTRKLGTNGPTVSTIGLGTMGSTLAYGPSDRNESIATIKKAFDLGVTFFDTAELYGQGEGEKLLGEALEGIREKVIVATKFGFAFTDGNLSGVDSRPERIRTVTENSLRYLKTDRIDVLYQHRVDPSVPMEDVAGTVAALIKEGKVRWFGMSEAGPESIRKAHAVTPVSMLQTEYSIFEREAESLFPLLRELGIGFVPYSPLGRGFLTDAVKPGAEYPEGDMRRWDDRYQGENFTRNLAATNALKDLAKSKNVTVAQLAIAWTIAKGPDIVPIPGTRNAKRLAENLGAADVTLTDADLKRVDEILPNGSYGQRYPEQYMPTWK